MYWAPLEDNPETLLLLIQWEVPNGWIRFQQSVGFGLMLKLRAPNCFNRAVRLALPADCPSYTDCSLELVYFQFKADTSMEQRQQFETRWNALISSVCRASDLCICGRWVERDGPSNVYSQALFSLSDSQPLWFLALVFLRGTTRVQGWDLLRQKAAELTTTNLEFNSTLTATLKTRTWLV